MYMLFQTFDEKNMMYKVGVINVVLNALGHSRTVGAWEIIQHSVPKQDDA